MRVEMGFRMSFAVSRNDIAEIYYALAAQAIRDLQYGTDEQAEDADERFMQYNAMGWKWQQHHEWVEDRRPKRATPDYMDD